MFDDDVDHDQFDGHYDDPDDVVCIDEVKNQYTDQPRSPNTLKITV